MKVLDKRPIDNIQENDDHSSLTINHSPRNIREFERLVQDSYADMAQKNERYRIDRYVNYYNGL